MSRLGSHWSRELLRQLSYAMKNQLITFDEEDAEYVFDYSVVEYDDNESDDD